MRTPVLAYWLDCNDPLFTNILTTEEVVKGANPNPPEDSRLYILSHV